MATQVLTCGNDMCKQKNRVNMDRIKDAFCGKCKYPMVMAVELNTIEDVPDEEPADDETDSGWTDPDAVDIEAEEVDDDEEEDEEDEEEEQILCVGCNQVEVDEEGTMCPNCEAKKQAAQARRSKGKAAPAPAAKPAAKAKGKSKK